MIALGFASPDTFAYVTLVRFLCFVGIVVFMVFSMDKLARETTKKLIDRWCVENGFKLISKKFDWLSSLRGPFAFDISQRRPVYLVVVEDQSGKLRKASVACGGAGVSILGLFPNRLLVYWASVSANQKGAEKSPLHELE